MLGVILDSLFLISRIKYITSSWQWYFQNTSPWSLSSCPPPTIFFISFHSLTFNYTGFVCAHDCDYYPSCYLCLMLFYQKKHKFKFLDEANSFSSFSSQVNFDSLTVLSILYWNLLSPRNCFLTDHFSPSQHLKPH